MPYTKISFKPGVYTDDSPLDAEGYFIDSDKIRFVRGKAQTIGGWEAFSSETFLGKCRGLHAWADASRNPYISVGTNLRLYAYDVDGTQYDITPVIDRGELTDPFTTTISSALVTVTNTGHGLVADQKVKFANASAVGGITIDGEYTVTSVTDANNYVITHSSAATSSAGPGGGTVDVEYFLAPGQEDGLGGLGYGTGGYGSGTFGSTNTGYDLYPRTWSLDHWGRNLIANPRGGAIFEWDPNLSATELVTNGKFTASAGWSAGTGWTVGAGVATASVSSASLEQSVTTNPYSWHLLDFDNTLSAGTLQAYYGTLTIGSAVGATGTNKITFFSNAGGSQKLKFTGSGFTGTVSNISVNVLLTAAQITNAPTQVLSAFVTAERILVACGCANLDGVFDPLRVAWSDQEDNQTWTSTPDNLAGGYTLSNGTRIVRGVAGRGENLIFTDNAVYSMRYVPDANVVYRFDLIGTGCGLIGPNAVAQVSGIFFWLTPGGEFYTYSGGATVPLRSTVRRYVSDNLSWVQQDKVYAFSVSAWGEVWWLYPDMRDGNECSRYVCFSYLENTWARGTFDRTAWEDAGVFQYPIAADSTGKLWLQEKDFSEDGGARTWSLSSAYFDLGDGDSHMTILGAYPDAEDLQGGYTVTVNTRLRDSRGKFDRTFGPFDITNATGKVSIRATSQQAQIVWNGNDAPTFFRMGAFRLDIKGSGRKR